MKRSIVACIAGLLTWAVVVSIIDRLLRLSIAGYAAAEPTMAFTLGMMWARQAMAAVTSIVAGLVVGAIAPASKYTAWVVGGVVLAAFIPAHIHFWQSFPLWYHLTFLVPLVPLVVVGARLMARRSSTAQPATV